MENWDEIRTAYFVARTGTVSGAADQLGVHHATVIRHVDALETRLGVKLFQRHARGYTATEAGRYLLRVAQATDEQFLHLAGRIRGQGDTVSGELMVTSLPPLTSFLMPMMARFQSLYPDVILRYLSDSRLFKLEYGEAHVAIRAGAAPDQPDNVVQPFTRAQAGLFASKSYVDRFGLPSGPEAFGEHYFIGPDDPKSRAPHYQWLLENAPPDRIVFRSSDTNAQEDAMRNGIGIGFDRLSLGRANPDLVEVMPPLASWDTQLWLVTHVDLHRTTKVQAFLNCLKASVNTGETE